MIGDADRRSPPRVAADLHAQIPASRLVVMPGVGHLSNDEATETYYTEIRHVDTPLPPVEFCTSERPRPPMARSALGWGED